MFSRPADEYRQVAILPAIVAPFRERKGHLMINTLPRRRFLKGAVTTGAVCLFGAPLSATNNSPHWLAVYPLWLSEPILQKLYVGRPGEVESCETFLQPRSVTAFHTGFTGRISPPASPTGTHDFYCALYTDTEAYTSGFSRVPGWPWWQATKSEPVRAITITDARATPHLFADLVESWRTDEEPVQARGIALITCVLNDHSAREAAVPAAEFARNAGFRTFALVSTGDTHPEEELAKRDTMRRLGELTEGVLEASLSEVVETCGKTWEGDPELSNEGEYLCQVASIISNVADRSTNVDTGDVAEWLSEGGSVRLKRVTLQHNFRNTPRRPLDEYAHETATWLGSHSPDDRCLILAPTCEEDGTSLVGLASALLDHAEISLDTGQNVLALQHDGFHGTVELLALSQRS